MEKGNIFTVLGTEKENISVLYVTQTHYNNTL